MGSVVRHSLSDGDEKMEKIFQLIIQNPGIGIRKLARLSEMSPNYILWILPRMELTGRLLTEGENGKLYFFAKIEMENYLEDVFDLFGDGVAHRRVRSKSSSGRHCA